MLMHLVIMYVLLSNNIYHCSRGVRINIIVLLKMEKKNRHLNLNIKYNRSLNDKYVLELIINMHVCFVHLCGKMTYKFVAYFCKMIYSIKFIYVYAIGRIIYLLHITFYNVMLYIYIYLLYEDSSKMFYTYLYVLGVC